MSAGDLPPGFIFEIARLGGIEVPDNGKPKRPCRCPLHGADKHPSAFLSESNVFFCSVCCSDGGWSAKRLACELGVPWEPPHGAPPPARRAAPICTFDARKVRGIWDAAQRRARNDEATQIDQVVYDYLERRGIAEAWESRSYGVVGEGMDLPSEIGWWATSGYRIVVPLFDLRANLASVQARNIGSTQPKTLFPKGATASGVMFSNARGLELLRGESAPGALVFVGEGLTDHLALSIAAPGAVLSVPGTSNAAGCIGPWVKGTSLVLAMDDDDAGARAESAAARRALECGADVYRIVWPDGCNDACDAILRLSAAGLSAFLIDALRGRAIDAA